MFVTGVVNKMWMLLVCDVSCSHHYIVVSLHCLVSAGLCYGRNVIEAVCCLNKHYISFVITR